MEILSFTTVTYFLCGLMDLFPGALRGMGRSGVPMILSILGTVGTRIVWIFWIFPAHRSLDILFISYPVSWILTILMQVICFWFVRKKVHESIRSRGQINRCGYTDNVASASEHMEPRLAIGAATPIPR